MKSKGVAYLLWFFLGILKSKFKNEGTYFNRLQEIEIQKTVD